MVDRERHGKVIAKQRDCASLRIVSTKASRADFWQISSFMASARPVYAGATCFQYIFPPSQDRAPFLADIHLPSTPKSFDEGNELLGGKPAALLYRINRLGLRCRQIAGHAQVISPCFPVLTSFWSIICWRLRAKLGGGCAASGGCVSEGNWLRRVMPAGEHPMSRRCWS